MNASTSWTGIPRDYREQERLRLEHQIFSNISFEPEDGINNLEFGNEQPSQHRPGFVLPYREDEDGMESSDFSVEFPRNPQLLSKDYAPDLSIRYGGHEHEEGETRSTAAHHASAVTFRTGLKGRPYSPADFEYDPDRQLDALLKGSSNLSFLNEDSRYNAPSKERSSRSEFTKRAQGLGKQIDHEKSYKPSPPAVNLNPYSQEVKATLPAAAFNNNNNTRVFPALSRVHLPDVTGITTAVATPLKGDVSLKRLPTKRVSLNQPNVNTAALDGLTKRLKDIEKENATSRRRVTELEMELETCRREVVHEKTRLQDISRSFGHQKSAGQGSKMQTNGTGITHANTSYRDTEKRYKQVVEEKKALEDLVQSLHDHLATMSRKVQKHQELISKLRTMREQDASELRAKCQEIEQLRADVDSLQSDVERLREVVEAGLHERKSARGEDEEPSVIRVNAPIQDVQNAEVKEDRVFSASLMGGRLRREHDALSAVMEESEPPSTRDLNQKTSSSRSLQSRRFIKDSELERVRAELEERRSQRSMTGSTSGSERSVSRAGHRGHSRSDISIPMENRPESPAFHHPDKSIHDARPRPLTPESVGTPILERRDLGKQREDKETQAPGRTSPVALPQIRGERLERLFHSAPEHNEKTCGVCHRRKRSSSSEVRILDEFKALPKHSHSESRNIRANGSRDRPQMGDVDMNHHENRFRSGDEQYISEIAARRGLPPQTVLARVIRELEDDFAHYKSIYVELADQYKAMDAASEMIKRNLLANHLREVIDILEQKGDQIASLYDLLHFEDKPIRNPPKATSRVPSTSK
ncbi:hypothetical protein CPB86DRAFT_758402 [Serendipita vermifera]|nr:hypothetical protein CPB86DRAFT_758402 [Serendipita vermifera]